MKKIGVAGLQREQIKKTIEATAPGCFEVFIHNDMEAAMKVKSGQLDYYIGACNTGAGAALSIAIAVIGYNKSCTIAKPGIKAKDEHIAKMIAEGKVAFGLSVEHVEHAIPMLINPSEIKGTTMDLYIQIIVVACLTGMTSLLAHRSAAVFHDGIRPILPQLIEGYMNRREAGSIAFGLSIGFVASVGISFTLKTGLLNAWLLFLPTDILGVLAINSLMAFGLGAIWGVLILTCLLPVNQLLTALPVDVLGSLGELSSPVVSAFALFPLVAIFYQFGWKQSLIAAVVVLMTRVVVVRYFPHLNPESIEIFIGMVMLLGIAITHDLRHRDENDIDASGLSVFEERTSRIIKNLPYIAIVGALIAAVASMKIFAGSEVSIFTLEKAYSAGVTPEQSQTLINQAALAEFMRGLGFVPLIATTALATGVYAVAGFTFVYAVGYLSPNPMVAAVLGAVVISAEVLLLRSIGKWLGRYPSVRNASDNIRNAMNMLMEVALLVGSIFAAIKMAGYTGFSIAVAIYFLNESLGRPVQKMAAPVVAVMITGILLNVLYWLGLFVPA